MDIIKNVLRGKESYAICEKDDNEAENESSSKADKAKKALENKVNHLELKSLKDLTAYNKKLKEVCKFIKNNNKQISY